MAHNLKHNLIFRKRKNYFDCQEYQKNYRSKNKNLMDKEKRAQYNKKYSEKKKLQSLLKSEQTGIKNVQPLGTVEGTQQYLTIESF